MVLTGFGAGKRRRNAALSAQGPHWIARTFSATTSLLLL